MKKWVSLGILYVIGGLFLYDVSHGFEWFQKFLEFAQNNLLDFSYYGVFYLYMFIFVLLLANYMLLRIKAHNPIYTFINALFFPVLLLLMFLLTRGGIDALPSEYLEFIEQLWESSKFFVVLYPLLFISGIVISEAKSKKSYLAAEFVYLFSGICLALFTFMFF